MQPSNGRSSARADASAATHWRLLYDNDGVDRLFNVEKNHEFPQSKDGISGLSCLKAAADAVVATGGRIIVAECATPAANTILPFRSCRRLGLRHIVPLTAPISQYAPDPPSQIPGTALHELLNVFREKKVGDLLLMRRVPEQSSFAQAMAAFRAAYIDHNRAPYIDLATFGSYQAYLKSFSRKSRRSRERSMRKLDRDFGSIRFDVLPGADACDLVKQALTWKRAWLQEQGVASSVFDGGVWEAALLECACAPNAFVSILEAGGRPVALELGFLSCENYASYLGAFDPAFGHYRVGQEQIIRAVSWCFERGLARYDLLPPEDDYKYFWTRYLTSEVVSD